MRMFIVLVLGVVCGGCQIGGLAPLYGKRDRVRDDRVVGVWVLEKDERGLSGNLLATVRPLPNGSYSLLFTAERREQTEDKPEIPLELQATLIKLGGAVYLDVEAPPDRLQELTGGYYLFVLPVHYYYRLEIGEDRIETATLGSRWFAGSLKEDPGAASYIRPGWGEPLKVNGEASAFAILPPFVLSGSTGAVQKFVADRACEPGAWEHSETYRRYQSLVPGPDGEE